MMRSAARARAFRCLTALVAALLLARAAPAAAPFYRYTDERGTPHYVEGLDSVPERFRAGATPLEMRNTTPPAAAPAATGKAAASGSTLIRFTPGERIMVEARINGDTTGRLLLDTGADRTVIAPRVLTAAGVSLTTGSTPGRIVGVTGAAEATGVTLATLEVGEAKVGPLLVVSHDMEQPGVDGLLGRDFLGQFHVSIDSTAGLVTIAPK